MIRGRAAVRFLPLRLMLRPVQDEGFEKFLRPFLAPQSIDAVKGDFARWTRALESRGIFKIPSPYSTDPDDVEAVNFILLMVKQASSNRDSPAEHNLRNLTKVRRYKS